MLVSGSVEFLLGGCLPPVCEFSFCQFSCRRSTAGVQRSCKAMVGSSSLSAGTIRAISPIWQEAPDSGSGQCGFESLIAHHASRARWEGVGLTHRDDRVRFTGDAPIRVRSSAGERCCDKAEAAGSTPAGRTNTKENAMWALHFVGLRGRPRAQCAAGPRRARFLAPVPGLSRGRGDCARRSRDLRLRGRERDALAVRIRRQRDAVNLHL